MGILGDWLPEDPDKNAAVRQGLLAAGAAMMASKGQNFFGTVGEGLLAGGGMYQGALEQQQQNRLRKAQQQRWDLENEQSMAALAREKEADDIIANYEAPGSISGAAGVQPASSDPQSPAGQASAGNGQTGGYSTPYLGPDPLGPPAHLPRIGRPGLAPAVDSSLDGAPGAGGTMPSVFAPGQPSHFLPSLEGLPMKDGAQPAPFRPPSLDGVPKIGDSPQTRADIALKAYERNMGLAMKLAKKGHIKRAKLYFDEAKGLEPKVKEIRELTTTDGKSVVVNMFEDGRPPQVIEGYAPPAPKLTYQDIGGETLGLDPRGGVVTRFKNSERPGTRSNSGAGTGAGSLPFSADAIDAAAARYNFDGTLPPMGMGKAGVQVRAAIMNRAAELAAGVAPTQQRRDQLENKGDTAAVIAARRSFGTGKDGQAVQSANTALNHLVTIRELAEAQKSGDMRAFNKAARALGAQFGQAEPTNLSAALVMVAPEISKAVIGAGGTGHERDQAQQALNPNGSPDQIIGATRTMEELFGGRLTEAKRTYVRTTKLSDFDETMLSPAARSVLAKQEKHAAAANGGGGKPRIKGIEELPKNPPPVGTVDQGHRFKGGNPADPKNWEKVR